MSLYNSFRNLVRILFGLLLLSRFKEEIVLKTSVLSVEVFRNDSVFKGRKSKCFSWKSEYLCAICFEFRSSTKPWFNFFFSPVHFCCWPLLKRSLLFSEVYLWMCPFWRMSVPCLFFVKLHNKSWTHYPLQNNIPQLKKLTPIQFEFSQFSLCFF